MTRRPCFLVVTALLCVNGAGFAQPPPLPAASVIAARAAHRFPQPVRVGDLIGRKVLAPSEAQPVLGQIVGVTRTENSLAMLMQVGGVLGIGARTVAVPVEAVALLGEYVAVMDYTPEQVAGLPVAREGSGSTLAASEVIRVGLARPFH